VNGKHPIKRNIKTKEDCDKISQYEKEIVLEIIL
jgi:hypothetical protein